MTREEFLITLTLLEVKEKGGEFRIKGFLIDYIKSPLNDYILIKGKIPYFLAKIIYEECGKYALDPGHEFLHPHEEEGHPTSCYITQIKITTPLALKYVIETIRDYPFINEWAIGNY